MTDEQGLKPNPTETVQDAVQPDADNLEALIAQITANPETAAKEMKRLRREAAAKREQAQKAQADAERLATLEAESRVRAEKELADQGKYRELAEQRERELAEAKAMVERLKPYQQTLEEQVQAQLEALTDAQKKLIEVAGDPLQTMQRLRAAQEAGILGTARPAPQMDAGAGGSSKAALEATAMDTLRAFHAKRLRGVL